MFLRKIKASFQNTLERGKSVLLLGPRQTGKTTFLKNIPNDLTLSFTTSRTRLRYEKDPSLLGKEIAALPITKRSRKRLPLIVLDEVQKVPDLMDEVQELIDNGAAQFILTGSSARKLKHQRHLNLLPGRIVIMRMTPLSLSEAPDLSLDHRLVDGSLPGIVGVASPKNREADLRSYVETYLEEEVRQEALVRSLGPFARFLELAAVESGRVLNASKIASDIGVSPPTVLSYLEILVDCLIVEPIEPITQSTTRKKLTKSRKFLFFDQGVSRVAAHLSRRVDPLRLPHVFEEWVGLELLRFIQQEYLDCRLRYWRDPGGPEVDWVLEKEDGYIPIEVKSTDRPSASDAQHVETFIREYPQAKKGFIICKVPRPLQVTPTVLALPWSRLGEVFG